MKCERCIHSGVCKMEIAPNWDRENCTWSKPTADVVPREEVAREIFEEIEREITDALKSNYKVLPQIELSEALWNNVNGKINALRGIEYFMEELKKKYTGE